MTKQEDKAIRACGKVIGMITVLTMPAIQAAPHLSAAFNGLVQEAMEALSHLVNEDGDLVLSAVAEV